GRGRLHRGHHRRGHGPAPAGRAGQGRAPGGRAPAADGSRAGERCGRGGSAMTAGPGQLRELLDAFQARFPFDPAMHPADETVVVRSPGRVNLIGEHTDYNDGFVLPLAIDREILLAGRRRKDETVRVFSLNMGDEGAFPVNGVAAPAAAGEGKPGPPGGWSRYVEGVVWVLREAGFAL